MIEYRKNGIRILDAVGHGIDEQGHVVRNPSMAVLTDDWLLRYLSRLAPTEPAIVVVGSNSLHLRQAYIMRRTAWQHFPAVVFACASGNSGSLKCRSELRKVGELQVFSVAALVQEGKVDVSRAMALSCAQVVCRLSDRRIPETIGTILIRAMLQADSPFSVSRLSQSMAMHERTLRKICSKHGIARPQHFVGVSRLLLYLFWHLHGNLTNRELASLLGFKSHDAVRKQATRFGLSVTRVSSPNGNSLAAQLEVALCRIVERGAESRVFTDIGADAVQSEGDSWLR